MAKKLKIYNGSSWEDVTFAITPPNTAVTNAFSTNQVIDASTSVAALRITQRGSGEAFRVEDETNPDSSAFVIDTSGHVYVGSVNSASKIPTTRQYLNIGGLSGTGVLQLLDAGSNSALSGLIEFHDLQNSANAGGTRNAYIAAFVDGTVNANNRGASLHFATKTDGVSNAATPRMVISNTGSVGIGSTSPEGRLLISGPNVTTDLHIQAYDDSTKRMTIQADNNVLRFYSRWTGGTGGEIAWHTGQPVTERLRLSASGQFSLLSAQDNAQPRIRNTYTSTSAPSGGNDGDMWAVYV